MNGAALSRLSADSTLSSHSSSNSYLAFLSTVSFSFSERVAMRRCRVGSHLIFTIAKYFLNGQTELGVAKSGRWMSRTVCRRPARWAPFFSTWPGHWPTLVSPGSLSLSFSRPPTRIRRLLSPMKRSPLLYRTGLPSHCHHHKWLPPSDRPPPPIFVDGAAYDLAMRLQQHMPWHKVRRSDRYHPVC